jgi:hypothetical protein
MVTIDDAAREMARDAATGGAGDRLLERLAELVGARGNVSAVFGEPIRQGDRTVVPVARVRWGIGGGSGRTDEAPAGPSSGTGGGGGVAADPVGYLVVTPEETTFHPIRAPYPSPAFLLAAGIAAAFVLRGLARLAGR